MWLAPVEMLQKLRESWLTQGDCPSLIWVNQFRFEVMILGLSMILPGIEGSHYHLFLFEASFQGLPFHFRNQTIAATGRFQMILTQISYHWVHLSCQCIRMLRYPSNLIDGHPSLCKVGFHYHREGSGMLLYTLCHHLFQLEVIHKALH